MSADTKGSRCVDAHGGSKLGSKGRAMGVMCGSGAKSPFIGVFVVKIAGFPADLAGFSTSGRSERG